MVGGWKPGGISPASNKTRAPRLKLTAARNHAGVNSPKAPARREAEPPDTIANSRERIRRRRGSAGKTTGDREHPHQEVHRSWMTYSEVILTLTAAPRPSIRRLCCPIACEFGQ